MLTAEQRQMVADNLRLVHSVAQKFIDRGRNMNLEYGDLVGQGSIGLIKAVQNFDESLGLQFSTYAIPQIKFTIQKSFMKSRRIKVSRPSLELRASIRKHGLDELPHEEIAARLKCKVDAVGRAFQDTEVNVTSLNAITFENDGDPITLIDMIPSYDDSTGIFVSEFLNRLTESERYIVEQRMVDRTQKQIGTVFGKSQVYVSRALKVIQKKLEAYERGEQLAANH